MPSRPRLGSLDDLRAAAILTVLACHLASRFYPGTPVTWVTSVGGRGVDLFFVLSGWLLGGQLFREANATGTVAVGRFWVRRWLRTLPAYYAVLAATCLYLAATGKGHTLDWRYLVFLQNYNPPLPYLGVTWTLCVEEHFYLVVGPAIWLAHRWRWGAAVVLSGVAGLLTVHALGLYTRNEQYETIVSHIRWEPCGVGVALAWLATNRPAGWAGLQRWAVPVAGAAAGLAVAAVLNRTVWGWALPDWGPLVWGLMGGAAVLAAVTVPGWRERATGPVSRYFASRAYSLYLMHMEGIALAQRLTGLPTAARVLVAVGLMLLAAEVLYRLVERPVLRWRDRAG